jgi:DNA modification methylase
MINKLEIWKDIIGIELDEKYFNIAKERIENAKMQESLILDEGE